ncbi:unnamed protein product [Owenia fusiformis]|uniref:Uncharacterized protein n=1 Tax=Owenia fusiformis TaxID=6347 RepID=A0A8J1UKQ8_OWEFU|nr:unnamed protein product [Owenia fusiformis]
MDFSLCLLLTVAVSQLGGTTGQLEGSVAVCDFPDGVEVDIPLISDDPCITCRCYNGEVTCERETCSKEGCHVILFDKPKDSCCDVCKGCFHDGKVYASGKEWTDPKNPCKTFKCQGGVVTEAKEQCFSPCANPLYVPGQCCPICTETCSYNGQDYENGETFYPLEDTCVECKCTDGQVQCSKKACPVLNCAEKFIYQPNGTCCPVCKGSRMIFDIPGRCFFRNKVYKNNQKITMDTCTQCTCVKGTMVCERDNCPILDCPQSDIVQQDGKCCPVCKEKPKQGCEFDGKPYEHGEVWKKDICSSCVCDEGEVRCQVQQCSNVLSCPRNYKLELLPNECCPRCVEKDAVCAVFGDPHYRTFDGKIYNFQGQCSYILTQDCHGQDFYIRVRNDGRKTSSFAWTHTIHVFIDGTKISLLQGLGVKVNGSRVKLPYYKDNEFQVDRDTSSVVLRTVLGVSVIWDGDSYVEVSVPRKYKNKLCGLCGNYNGSPQDDLTGRDGMRYTSSAAFGATWRVGSKKCNKKPPAPEMMSCKNKFIKKLRVHKQCNILKDDMFAACVGKVDVKSYFKSCTTDVCDCPRGKKCVCESVRAYARACEREGVNLGDWESKTKCGEGQLTCPKGAVYDTCADPCPRTCADWDKPRKCSKMCAPGCSCPHGTVLHKNKCIKASRCSKKRNQI